LWPNISTSIPLERHRGSHEIPKSVQSDSKQIFNTDPPKYALLTFILKVLISYLDWNTELYDLGFDYFAPVAVTRCHYVSP